MGFYIFPHIFLSFTYGFLGLGAVFSNQPVSGDPSEAFGPLFGMLTLTWYNVRLLYDDDMNTHTHTHMYLYIYILIFVYLFTYIHTYILIYTHSDDDDDDDDDGDDDDMCIHTTS